MRVVQALRFGGPEVLVASEAPDPVAGPGQVVVDVAVADVLFLETQLRSGWGREYFDLTPPYVPGTGVAGQVSSVGEGVDGGWVGRSVVAGTDGGGYAERAVAAAEGVVAVPDGLGLTEAAGLLQVGPAALSLADGAEIKAGEWVLVTAAAGGLGSLLVQLARTAGARVIAAARGEGKLDLTRDLGAGAVVDYSEAGWPERVREAADGLAVDVVFDGVGGQIGRAAFGVAARGGRFFAYGVPSGDFARIDPGAAERRGVRLAGIEQVQFAPADMRRLVARALGEAAAGRS